MTATLGVGLVVGQRTLNPSAEVRILDPQPNLLNLHRVECFYYLERFDLRAHLRIVSAKKYRVVNTLPNRQNGIIPPCKTTPGVKPFRRLAEQLSGVSLTSSEEVKSRTISGQNWKLL